MTLNNKMLRSLIACVFALTVVSIASGARVVYAAESEDNSMIQYLIDAVSKIEIHGFASQGFLWSSDHDYLFANTSNGDWHFNEIGLNFSTELNEKLRVGLQLFSRSLGSVGNNAVQLDWAYADYRFRDWLGFRGGKMKNPLWLYNEVRDIDQLRTCIILPQSVYPENSRAFSNGVLGLSVYGEIPFESAGSFSYEAQAGTVTVHKSETAVDQQMAGMGGLYPDLDMNMDQLVIFNLIWDTPFDGLRLAGGAQYIDRMTFSGQLIPTFSLVGLGSDMAFVSVLGNGDVPAGSTLTFSLNPITMFALSIEYVYENATLVTEYRLINIDINPQVSLNGLPTSMTLSTQKIRQEGFYLLLSYALTDSFEIGTYYSLVWPDASDRRGVRLQADGTPVHSAWQHDIALSARYDIFSFWTVKLEGHYLSGTGDLLLSDNPLNNRKEHWFLGAFKTSVMF